MNTIRTWFIGLCCLSLLSLRAQTKDRLAQVSIGLIPYPKEIKLHTGYYQLGANVRIYSPEVDFAFATRYLDSTLCNYPKLKTERQKVPKRTDIQLLRNSEVLGQEAYRLSIQPSGIKIEASHQQGALYGVITLSQLLESHYIRHRELFDAIECLVIEDSPRYKLRALMLDPARHFLPVADVKAYIEQMLHYKFNTLQLHLSDDQGWRIEIKKHPKLTAQTALRELVSPWGGRYNKAYEQAVRGFYTQDEIRELVAFAAERGISIIPEIDVPGHTAALLAAYPELRIQAQRDSVFQLGKTDNVMLSAVSDSTYHILSDIFSELAELFPRGTYLHLGGDESAIERNWAKDKEHLALMKRLGYNEAEELMNYFFSRLYDIVRPLGFRLMQWCELDNIRLPANKYLMDYPSDVTLVSWRMGLTPKCIELSRQSGHQLLLAPGESAYLDYPQWTYDLPEFNNWGMPITTLEQSYNFDLRSGISANNEQHIIGIMGTLWAEAIPNITRAFYMTYPRAIALAEVGWTVHSQRSWERFKTSVPVVLNSLGRRGLPYRPAVELYQ